MSDLISKCLVFQKSFKLLKSRERQYSLKACSQNIYKAFGLCAECVNNLYMYVKFIVYLNEFILFFFSKCSIDVNQVWGTISVNIFVRNVNSSFISFTKSHDSKEKTKINNYWNEFKKCTAENIDVRLRNVQNICDNLNIIYICKHKQSRQDGEREI